MDVKTSFKEKIEIEPVSPAMKVHYELKITTSGKINSIPVAVTLFKTTKDDVDVSSIENILTEEEIELMLSEEDDDSKKHTHRNKKDKTNNNNNNNNNNNKKDENDNKNKSKAQTLDLNPTTNPKSPLEKQMSTPAQIQTGGLKINVISTKKST